MSLELPLYSIIPHEVLVNKDVPAAAKIFYGVLSGLCRKEGYCWASDNQLAEMMETKERTMKSWLLSLEKEGFIHRRTENKSYRDEEGKLLWKKTRKIFLAVSYSNKSCERAKNDPIDERAENCPSNERAENCPYKEGISKEGIPKGGKDTPPPPPDPSTSYGSDGLVQLSTNEYDKLVADIGQVKLTELIESLNDYMGSTGKTYKSHYHTLKSWHRKDKKETSSRREKSSLSFEGEKENAEWTPKVAKVEDFL